MKEFLSRAGVAFTERDVDTDASAYDDLLARGFRSVPLTCAGSECVRGFEPAALERLIEQGRRGSG